MPPKLLTDTKLKAAKPRAKPYKEYDSGGLHALVHPNGSKYWRLKYRRPHNKKENQLPLGKYPEVSIAQARRLRDEAKEMLALDLDPAVEMKKRKLAGAISADNSFEAVANAYLAKQQPTWSEVHHRNIRNRLEKDIYPKIGNLPITTLRAPQILGAIRPIEERGRNETAHRALANCGAVFKYAVATGICETNPCRDLSAALAPVKRGHRPATTDPKELGEIIRLIEAVPNCTVQVRAALRLCPLVFLRPSEVVSIRWCDIDEEENLLVLPIPKTDTQLLVPLSIQARAIIDDVGLITKDRSEFVFQSPKKKTIEPITGEAILKALRKAGVSQETTCNHGFRVSARTMLEERLGYRPEVVELGLSHTVKGPLGRAYNRTQHLDTRREMMQVWADYLDKLKHNSANPNAEG